MHDYLQIIGVSKDASYREVRRLAARRVRRTHPDFGATGPAPAAADDPRPPCADAAVDFVEVSALAERIQRAFFHSPS